MLVHLSPVDKWTVLIFFNGLGILVEIFKKKKKKLVEI